MEYHIWCTVVNFLPTTNNMNNISDKNYYKCKIKMKNIDYYYIILNQKMSENILKFLLFFDLN